MTVTMNVFAQDTSSADADTSMSSLYVRSVQLEFVSRFFVDEIHVSASGDMNLIRYRTIRSGLRTGVDFGSHSDDYDLFLTPYFSLESKSIQFNLFAGPALMLEPVVTDATVYPPQTTTQATFLAKIGADFRIYPFDQKIFGLLINATTFWGEEVDGLRETAHDFGGIGLTIGYHR